LFDKLKINEFQKRMRKLLDFKCTHLQKSYYTKSLNGNFGKKKKIVQLIKNKIINVIRKVCSLIWVEINKNNYEETNIFYRNSVIPII